MKNKKWIILLTSILILAIALIGIAVYGSRKNSENVPNNQISEDNQNASISESKILQVTNENFENEVLNCDKIVLIDFYTDWCKPCQKLSSVLEEVAEENQEVKIVRINRDEQSELKEKYEIKKIPTLIILKDGKEINRSIGFMEKQKILDFINI